MQPPDLRTQISNKNKKFSLSSALDTTGIWIAYGLIKGALEQRHRLGYSTIKILSLRLEVGMPQSLNNGDIESPLADFVL